ncbi:hypothetical protein KKF84_14200, partial [Myxococcota bacterium]|nr:hypothetical protein [Myxococcota bacterium]MBU1536475.1 hypothetical protein [Myxococcota bacterium]
MLSLPGCESASGPLFVEYCVPVSTGGANDSPPMVGMVLDYSQMSEAPLGGDPSVLSFLIASEVPVTIVGDSSIPPGDTWFGESSIAVVDQLSAGDTGPVAARLTWENLPVAMVTDPSLLYPLNAPPFDGILGGDVLRRFAVRFHYEPDRQCTFSWDTADPPTQWPNVLFTREEPRNVDELGEDGYGVVTYELAGGGDFLDGDIEREFSATRVIIGVCIEPDAFPIDATDLSI